MKIAQTRQVRGFSIHKNQESARMQGNKRAAGGKKVIDASALRLGTDQENRIESRRNFARKQAMKLISDAWARDDKSAQGMKELNTKKVNARGELSELRSKIKELDDRKENLRQAYGIDKDSAEQKDLELLEKYQNNRNGSSFDSFSEEEIGRLKELQHTPLTDYQKKALEMNDLKGSFRKEADRKQWEIIGIAEGMMDAAIEQLKSQDLQKSKGAAEQLLDASDKEILGMLIQDGKKAVDEKSEEEKEKTAEIEEKREEQQERIDKQREEQREVRKMQERLLEGESRSDQLKVDVSMQKSENSEVQAAQKDIRKLLRDNNLINEDIKGIEIDLNF